MQPGKKGKKQLEMEMESQCHIIITKDHYYCYIMNIILFLRPEDCVKHFKINSSDI